MSCGSGPGNIKSCVSWEKAFEIAMDNNLKSNETEAQMNLERQIGRLKADADEMWCLNKEGLYKKPIDEFCRVAKKLQLDGRINNQVTNQAIDKFCK